MSEISGHYLSLLFKAGDTICPLVFKENPIFPIHTRKKKSRALRANRGQECGVADAFCANSQLFFFKLASQKSKEMAFLAICKAKKFSALPAIGGKKPFPAQGTPSST